MLYDHDTFEHAGHKFRVEFPYDDCGDAPWERADGHGIVSDWTSRAKRPGEMILAEDGGRRRYYDFQGTVAIARRDGWDAAPYGGTRGQRAHRAAMADFDYLRRWFADQWSYVGVVVHLLDDAGDDMGESDSLWGIESDAHDALEETARELADEILHRVGAQLAA